jgi:putative DNA primase/helicase
MAEPLSSISDVLAQFRAAAAARGLELPTPLEADGKLHRCPLSQGVARRQDGAYLLHLDGVPAGGFQNFKDGMGWENWRADIGRQLTPEEEAAHRARVAEQQAAREAATKERRDKARRKANGIWGNAKPAPEDHPYLARKGVKAFGLRMGLWPKWEEARPGEWKERRIPALLVPMRSASGTLHSMQAIFAERLEDGLEKAFLSGGSKSSRFHLIGTPAPGQPLCVAEGYATAASIHMATGYPVAVAFDAGNLEAVALELHKAFEGTPLVLCADDDAATPGNPGLTKAQAAARAVGGVVAVPAFGPDRAPGWTDFNDMHTAQGLDAVAEVIRAAWDGHPGRTGEGDGATPTPPPENPTSAPETPPEPLGEGCPEPAPEPAPDAPPKKPRKAKGDAQKRTGKGRPQAEAQHGFTAGEVFELRDGPEGRGVYRLKVEKRGESFAQSEQFVCAPLEITHMVRDAKGEGWSRLAVFDDHDGRRRRVLVPDDMLEGDGSALARLLRGNGLFVGDNKGGLLKMYVNRSRPSARARLTARIGWHESVTEPGRWSFVQGADLEPITAPGAELWMFSGQGSGGASFKQAGTPEEWRDHVARLAQGNSRLLFALSAGFAGGLCWLHPNVPGGFHWAGGSSLGKSALLYATASLCGGPAYRKTWMLTATAIESVAAGHCDAPLLLDELKQAGNPRDVAQAAYMLTSGQGKGRGQAAGGLRETASFSLLFQSNGELGLTQFLEEQGEKAYAGQEIRFCELPADAGAGLGCWEELHGLPDGARFSEAVQSNAARYHGTAYPAFIQRVMEHRDALPAEFEALRQAFEERGLSSKAGGQVIRAATRFAAVAFAGEKATEWGITGWQQGEATRAAMQMLKAWVRAYGGEQNREPRKMVAQVQAWVQANSVGRLEDMRRPCVGDTHAPRVMNRAGWKRPTEETRPLPDREHVLEYLIYPEFFRAELCQGFDHKQVVGELVKRDLLVKTKGASDRHTIKVREPGAGPANFYALAPSILEWSEDEDQLG